jgi:succinyl-CoA synthetase alpha subunit
LGSFLNPGFIDLQAADQVVKQGLGITTAIGIGGDPIMEQQKKRLNY